MVEICRQAIVMFKTQVLAFLMWNYLDHSTLLKLSQVLNNNFHSILVAGIITELLKLP